MKKHLYLIMALATILLASCKNEDITITREIKFTVNPYEVVDVFVNNQVNVGDLDELYTGQMLRVQVLVYDAEGQLANYDVQYLANYHSTMNTAFDLDDGNYTAIAITDVVEYNGSSVTLEYWRHEGKDRLSTLKINHGGYLGYESKILGIGHVNFKVQPGQNTIAVPVEPQGALMLNIVWGIHSFNDVTCYDLMTNRSFNRFEFEDDGSCKLYYDDVNYITYLYRFAPANYSSYGGYGYQFVPAVNTGFRCDAETTSGNLQDITGGAKTKNIALGGMYQFELFLPDLTFTISSMSNGKGASQDNLSRCVDKSQYCGLGDR